MAGDYYIGSRRRKTRTKGCVLRRFLLTLCFFALVAMLGIHLVLYPQAKALCTRAVTNRLEGLANETAYAMLADGGYTYEDFIKLSYAADGTVCAASVDTVRLNLLKSRLAIAVLGALRTTHVTAEVSLGSLTGLLLLSERGENLQIKAKVAESMRAKFHTVFTSVGINQTRHAIGFSLDFTATYFLSSRTENVALSVQIPMGETVIVGRVPDSLTQINRLSDDVTEIEIDDAVDFGNVLS